MDHSAANQAFVDDLLAGGEIGTQVIDLGCGPAAIAIELCQRDPHLVMMAVDADIEMLEVAKLEIDSGGMLDRITLEHADATQMDDFQDELADTVISNSLIHHLSEPLAGLRTCRRLVRSGGRLFVRDLARPRIER